MLFFTDNDSVVHVINNQTTKDTKMLALLRRMPLICLRNNILFRTRHIQGRRKIRIKICWLIVYVVYRSTNPNSVSGHGPNTNPAAIVPLPESWEIG